MIIPKNTRFTTKLIIIASIIACLVIVIKRKYLLKIYNNYHSERIGCPKTPFNGARDIYFSQTYEDYVLGNVFSDVEKGFYVDVGAHDPNDLSVTKYFYRKGWSGINFEPLKLHYDKLVAERPRDININKAVNDVNGSITLYVPVDIDVLSSTDKAIADLIAKNGSGAVKKIEVEAVTLTDAFEKHKITTIDFLKIDVEGAEDKVVSGLDFKRFRPKIVVLEHQSPINAHGERKFDPIMKQNDYILGMTDVLNHYYYRKEDPELGIKLKELGKCVALDRPNFKW